MHIEVPNIPREILRKNSSTPSESSQSVQRRVIKAYKLQQKRAKKTNSKLSGRELEQYCHLETEHIALLERAIDKLGLSARAMHRILRITRTIADLAGRDKIELEHLTEAIGYRRMEFMKSMRD